MKILILGDIFALYISTDSQRGDSAEMLSSGFNINIDSEISKEMFNKLHSPRSSTLTPFPLPYRHTHIIVILTL